VIITVTGLPPVANNDTVTTVFNAPVDIPVLHNDYSPDADTLELCGGTEIVTGPHNGTLTVNSDGTITYLPHSGYTGIDSFQYKICDPDGADTAWAIITITDCQIQNGFSPNNDGINETFIIPCSDGPVFLNIFNRWGIEVYRTENYDNTWSGMYKGAPLPDGTYYYVLKYKTNQGNSVNEAGFVVIHR
jgi:gliding motility-associated-like protein